MIQSISNFNELVDTIQKTHQALHTQSVKAVNIGLTIRNWLVGYYIVEFEQNGEDRAKYGDKLLLNLSKSIAIRGLSETNLKYSRLFYLTYSEISQLLTDELVKKGLSLKISQFEADEFEICETNSIHLKNIFRNISFTHIVELIKIDNPVKRKYYELLILKTQPSVSQLKREIATLSYERLGMSADKEKAFTQIHDKITPIIPQDAVKSHYFFEFLNINSPELIEETELESALINHLQQFIIELGNGFCFEARQNRILIGDEYFFIDLVFYHRILKCHVLIELKVDSFNHSHASQLVTYLNYYKKNLMEDGDNPPIGILLVTDRNSALVEYATANDKDRLFVSKYKLSLPSEEELKSFLENELKRSWQA
jgi:predicted nuclease of restriction endonuclease-like (RecB) superfamily